MEEKDRMFFESVVDAYRKSGESIRDASITMGLSRTKVRKILITMGEITSEITENALRLMEEGKPRREAAKILGISDATLSTYLPYGNRLFGREERSDDAIRSEKYRERQTIAANGQVMAAGGSDIKREVYDMNREDEIKVMRIRLELEAREDELEVLRKYGKAENGIVREFIVPTHYPLHALHYAIQKAFGWQNSHLHHFELAEEDFKRIVGDSFQRYCMLCGLYFRCPYGDDFSDIYWDDDYKEGRSFKSWLRSKYTAPYFYGGISEHYLFAHNAVKAFREEHGMVTIPPSFEEYRKGIEANREVNVKDATCEEMGRVFDAGFEELIERASIGDIMGLSNGSLSEIDGIARELESNFDYDFTELLELLGMKKKAEKLRKKEDRLFTNRKSGTALDAYLAGMEANKLEKEFEEGIDALFKRTNAKMPPICKELIYKYDYGDGWTVRITCVDEYACEEGQHLFRNSRGEGLGEGLNERVFGECGLRHNPICVMADGLPVMDDVGGVGGYCDFLKNIKEGTEEGPYGAPEESREWARGMGWTGRMSKPENIL